MQRKIRTEILIRGSAETAAKLAQEIVDKYVVKIIEAPNNGLVMVKVRETAKNSLFYIGEVLITECKVLIEGCLGSGIIKGHEGQRAFHLAVIDAAYNAGLIETEGWTKILLADQAEIKKKERDAEKKILKTKVNFETMDV